MKKFDFSVVVAGIGKENEIENTINSICTQADVNNIQLILVSPNPTNTNVQESSSTNSSLSFTKIQCNSTDIHQLWNAGKSHANGEFINFIAAGNTWDSEAFCNVLETFNTNDNVNLVLCRTKRMKDYARFTDPGDFRFTKDDYIDTQIRYSYILDSIQPIFIKKVLIDTIEFPSLEGKASDILFASKLLEFSPVYHISKDAIFLNNEIQQSTEMPADVFKSFLNDACPTLFHGNDTPSKLPFDKDSGEVSRYNQHAAAWLIKELVRNTSCKLTVEQTTYFKEKIYTLVNKIEDRVLWNISDTPYAYRCHLLNIKHGNNNFDHSTFHNRVKAEVSIVKIIDDKLHLEGLDKSDLLGDGYGIYIKDNQGNKYTLDTYAAPCYDNNVFDGTCALCGKIWQVDLPIAKGLYYGFYLDNGENNAKNIQMKFTKTAPFTNSMNSTYFFDNKYLFKYSKGHIHITSGGLKSVLDAEDKYAKELKEKGKENYIPLRKKVINNKLMKRLFKKETWLISDRTNIAGDNGEVFYRFLINSPAAKKYSLNFVISKSSTGYDRVKDLPNVIDYDSKEYKELFLTCDKIISSQKADWVWNAFGTDREYMKNLYSAKRCFLQHGIIRNDMSKDFHKVKLNLDLFVTSVDSERNKILELYGYDESQVKLTGLPRYDNLVNESEKVITFLPTWRQYIEMPTKTGISNRPYSHNFKKYEYFNFYNNLINDSRILDAMRKHGYRGNFYVHPLFEAQACDFEGNDVISVNDKTANYQKVFKESNLLITDYSSVDFDFAYLNKPLVYTMFDKELFFNTHTSDKTFFDYDNDGFGPVCYDYETSVAAIVKLIENDCIPEEKYTDNINKFFHYYDRNNCQRVFDAIIEV